MSKARNLSDFISDPSIDATEIADGAVTASKLHTTLDLSGKTVTLASDAISGNSVHGGVISGFASTGIDDNASSTAVTIDSSGQVGIGTTNPIGAINISDNNTTYRTYMNSQGDFIIGNTASPDMLQLIDHGAVDETDASAYIEYSHSTVIGGSATRMAYLGFGSSNNQNFTLRNETSVGHIYLSVAGSGSIIAVPGSTGKFSVNHPATSGTNLDVLGYTVGAGGFFIGVQDASATNPVHRIRTYDNESISIANAYDDYVMFDGVNNRVGIGTDSPSQLLHINSATNTRLRISTTNTGAVPEIQLYNAAKEWKIGVETSTDGGGGAYSNAGASAFVIRNQTDSQTQLVASVGGDVHINRDLMPMTTSDGGNTGGLFEAQSTHPQRCYYLPSYHWYGTTVGRTYTAVCNITGSSSFGHGRTIVDIIVHGGGGNSVATTYANIMLSHYRDVLIDSRTLYYSDVGIKVTFNSGNDCTIWVAANWYQNNTYSTYVEIQPKMPLKITMNPSSTYSDFYHEHIASGGVQNSSNSDAPTGSGPTTMTGY